MNDDECRCSICGAMPGEEHKTWRWDRVTAKPINLPVHLDLSDLAWSAFMDAHWPQ